VSTQEDPIGVAGGINLYQFNNNDPATYTDPFGLATCPPKCGGIHALGVAVGAIVGGTVGTALGAGGGTLVAPGPGTFVGGLGGGVKGAAIGAVGGLAAANVAEAAAEASVDAMGKLSKLIGSIFIGGTSLIHPKYVPGSDPTTDAPSGSNAPVQEAPKTKGERKEEEGGTAAGTP
jgi:uncharacterized protein RhaS with RHS repeats